ncbi:hypothetical protein BASA60_001789 [Batrachochytrium salamandrivorans]|nr:hypothetical protein BASA60_001789 [Batrachochytrium salamandrivorans]
MQSYFAPQIVHQHENQIVHQHEDQIVHQHEDHIVHLYEDHTVYQQENHNVHQHENHTVHQHEDHTVHQHEDHIVHLYGDHSVHQHEGHTGAPPPPVYISPHSAHLQPNPGPRPLASTILPGFYSRNTNFECRVSPSTPAFDSAHVPISASALDRIHAPTSTPAQLVNSLDDHSKSSVPTYQYFKNENNKPSRFTFGCVPRSPAKRALCITSVVFILAMMVVVVFLLFPTEPTFEVASMTMPNSTASIKVQDHGTNPNAELSVSADFLTGLNISNPNRYGITLDLFSIDGLLIIDAEKVVNAPPTGQSIGLPNHGDFPIVESRELSHSIGSGSTTNLYIPAKSTINVELLFSFNYSPNPSTGLLRDPAFAEILQSCGVTSPRRPMHVTFTAAVQSSLFKLLRHPKPIVASLNMDCPFDAATVSAMVKNIADILRHA